MRDEVKSRELRVERTKAKQQIPRSRHSVALGRDDGVTTTARIGIRLSAGQGLAIPGGPGLKPRTAGPLFARLKPHASTLKAKLTSGIEDE